MHPRLVTVFVLFICVASTPAQSKERLKNLLREVATDEKAVAECEKIRTQAQIKEFGKPLPKISGHCWDGCPTLMPKPDYPERARRNRISGQVVISAVVDEQGKVIYARMIKGNRIFRQSAVAAAYASTYQPKFTCGNRPIKFWWTINYLFRPDM